MEGVIEVYKDWTADELPQRLGILRVQSGRTGELFDFTFDDEALTDSVLSKQTLDPELGIFPGPQFPKVGE